MVSATGHQQRLAREGMVMKNGKAPSEDAVKKERLITEIASGVKMLELGLPARLSKDSLSMVDYWTRELKEDPCLIDAIEKPRTTLIERVVIEGTLITGQSVGELPENNIQKDDE